MGQGQLHLDSTAGPPPAGYANRLAYQGYSVEIIGGKHYKTPDGEFVELKSGTQYKIQVKNSHAYGKDTYISPINAQKRPVWKVPHEIWRLSEINSLSCLNNFKLMLKNYVFFVIFLYNRSFHMSQYSLSCNVWFNVQAIKDFSNSLSVKYWYKEYSGDKIILLAGFQ